MLHTACGNTKVCKEFKHHFEECGERVAAGNTIIEGETCVEELCAFSLSSGWSCDEAPTRARTRSDDDERLDATQRVVWWRRTSSYSRNSSGGPDAQSSTC